MNLAALTDNKLSNLRQKIVHEIERRTKIVTKGLDAAAVIYGNELAKRALIVAAAGEHSVLFVGPPNCGKSMMRAAAMELGLVETVEAWPCPCGNRSDPRAACCCSARKCERHLRKLPSADIVVEMVRPTHREIGQQGTTLADMQRQIEAAANYWSLELGPVETSLHRAAVVELNLDPAAQLSMLSVARTIANLDGCERIGCSHLAEAINYRPLDRS